MGPSPSEGAELERRNSQESTNYRRPADQQHQPSHHIQPSNPGKVGGLRASQPAPLRGPVFAGMAAGSSLQGALPCLSCPSTS